MPQERSRDRPGSEFSVAGGPSLKGRHRTLVQRRPPTVRLVSSHPRSHNSGKFLTKFIAQSLVILMSDEARTPSIRFHPAMCGHVHNERQHILFAAARSEFDVYKLARTEVDHQAGI